MILIIKLSGKAKVIFPLFASFVKQQGNKTLGDLVKANREVKNA